MRSFRALQVGVIAGVCVATLALWRARSAPRPDSATVPVAPARATGAAPPSAAHPTAVAPALRPLSRAELDALAEARLMARLREVASSDPALAVALSREGNRRFPGSAEVAERTSILIHALASLGRSAEARGEAEAMVNGTPDSAWVREIERFTGAHRHRNVRINDAGAVEYYDP